MPFFYDLFVRDMISFVKAISNQHFKVIENLADTIWKEHYIPIIGEAQVNYMLSTFQSEKAVEKQVLEGFQYYIIVYNTKQVGYIAIKKDSHDLFLSKFYILKSERGTGIGRSTLYFIENKATNLKCKCITLTVNKENTNTINAYTAMGFEKLSALTVNIGNGFVMDDYKMIKHLSAKN